MYLLFINILSLYIYYLLNNIGLLVTTVGFMIKKIMQLQYCTCEKSVKCQIIQFLKIWLVTVAIYRIILCKKCTSRWSENFQKSKYLANNAYSRKTFPSLEKKIQLLYFFCYFRLVSFFQIKNISFFYKFLFCSRRKKERRNETLL